MKIITPIILMLIALGCSSQNNADTSETSGKTKDLVTAEQFKTLLDSNSNAVIIDVRTAGEFNNGAIPGALNIDYYSADFINESLKQDTTKPIYIYCRSGARSAAAALKLQEAGFSTIYELQGGILNWSRSNYPTNH